MGRDARVIRELDYVYEYPNNTEILIDFYDKFTLYDIIEKKSNDEYLTNRGLDVKGIIDDLRRCLVVSMSDPITYVLKTYDSLKDIQTVNYKSRDEASKILKDIIVGEIAIDRKMQFVSLWDIYFNNQKLFMVRGLRFYSTDPTVYSYFKGYPYQKVDEVNMDLIQPFLDHIRKIITDNDENAYEYVLKWIASIFQKPSFMTTVVLLLLGDQGTGKTTFTDVICTMMGRYANNNVTSLNAIAGQFNTTIENKKLIVLNELQSIDGNGSRADRNAIGGTLKSIITDKYININGKFKEMRLAENVSNYIMVSNNTVPVTIELTDRRYMVLNTSKEHMQDKVYFGALNKTIETEGFYENLFTYFMNLDISEFNVFKIPITEAKQNIQDVCMDTRDAFIRDKYKKIVNVKGPELYAMFKKYCEKNGYEKYSGSRSFLIYIKKYTGDPTQKKIDGKNTKVYNIKDEYIEKFAKDRNEPIEAVEKVTMDKNVMIGIIKKIYNGDITKDDLIHDLRFNSGINWEELNIENSDNE